MTKLWPAKFGKRTYFMSRNLFISLVLAVIIVTVWAYIDLSTATSLVYIHCPNTSVGYLGDNRCVNPVYGSSLCGGILPANSSACTMNLLPAGFTIGSPPPFVFSNYNTIIFLLFAVFLVGNHLLYNRKFFEKGDEDES